MKINSAQKQVVAGLNYVLVVETAAGGEKETYEAKVYGKQLLNVTYSETMPYCAQLTDSFVLLQCGVVQHLIDIPSSAVAEPLGNQPLKLTSHKKVNDETAQRKTEESSERSSGALLGGYREVHNSSVNAH